jgi:hypothetical protein
MFWREELDKLRERDPALLVKMVLRESDIVCGIRAKIEFEAAKALGLIDLSIWVDRDVPVDPTLSFGVDDCDMVLRNHSTVEDLYLKLEHLARSLRLQVY